MKKRYEPAEIERPELKNCMKAGFPANTYQAGLTEYMIRLNSGGVWRRVHFATTRDDGRPEVLEEGAESYYYIKLSNGSRTVIVFPDEFFGGSTTA